jgi:ribosomal protein S18 acetylase RimI-like enzyme
VGILVRPARASDAALLAETALMASRSHVNRGAWDLCFQGDDAERLSYLRAFAVGAPASFFHWSVGLVGEADGVPGAALSAATPAAVGSFDPTPTMVAVLTGRGWTAGDLAAMDHRLAPFLTCTFDPAPGALLIENVGTRAPLRRRGLVHALLERALAEGRAAGCQRAQLSILAGNTAAQRAYEAVGFRVVAERHSPAFAATIPGCPGLALMECPLGG